MIVKWISKALEGRRKEKFRQYILSAEKVKVAARIPPQKNYDRAMRGDFGGYDTAWEMYMLRERKVTCLLLRFFEQHPKICVHTVSYGALKDVLDRKTRAEIKKCIPNGFNPSWSSAVEPRVQWGLDKVTWLLSEEVTRVKRWATMTVEELRGMTKDVVEHSKIPKKAKDTLDFILGFLDGVIEGKDLGQIRGFEMFALDLVEYRKMREKKSEV